VLKPSSYFSAGRTPGRIILFAFSVYIIICFTGFAPAAEAVSQNTILKSVGYASVDPGFSLIPPSVNTDSNFYLPYEIDVDPDFSIKPESNEVSIAPSSDGSVSSSVMYLTVKSADSVENNP